MTRFRIILGLLAFLVIAAVLFIKIILPARAISQTDPDFVAIQTTLRTYADIKDQALITLDDSGLSKVLANDPRGGLVEGAFLGVVRWFKGNPNLKLEDIGFLDINQARYASQRKVKELYDAAAASGEIKILPIPTDNAILPTPYDPRDTMSSPEDKATQQAVRSRVTEPGVEDVPEIMTFEKEIVFPIGLPIPTTEVIRPTGFKLLSVSVEGDLAHAKVDWDYGLADDILVNKDGNWYLVGEKILQWHG